MPRGRPKVKDSVRINWRVKKTTERAIKARVVKGTKLCTPGRVLDATFGKSDV
jgi:hypothetical protein